MANERIKECVQRATEDLIAVKQAVINAGVEVPDGTPSSQYASKITEVYEKGKADDGDTDAAYEQGKADEQRAFWETYQSGGARKAYHYAFAYMDDDMFNPLYAIDISNGCNAVFVNSTITEINVPIISCAKTTAAYNTFRSSYLRKISSLIVCEDTYINAWFQACSALEELYLSGTLAVNGFDAHWSTLLNHDSIGSIITTLSTTTTGLTVTLSLTAVNNAFETSEGVADGSTSEEWLNLVATRENWTVALA